MEKLRPQKSPNQIVRLKGEARSSSFQRIDDDYAVFDVVVSSGAAVYREERDAHGNVVPFMRSLEISADAINMERLLTVCPVLNNHNDGREGDSVNKQLGTVQKAWIENGADGPLLIATLKIQTKNKEEREIADKIESGILRGVSVGAEIHSQKNITSESDEIMQVVADSWEPYEVSLVMVPADVKSIIRSKPKKDSVMAKKKQEQFSSKQLAQLALLVRELLEEERMKKKDKLAEEDDEASDEEEAPPEDEEKMTAEEKEEAKEEEEAAEEEAKRAEEVADTAGDVADEVCKDLPVEVTPEQEADIKDAIEGVLAENVSEEDELAMKIRHKLERALYARKKFIPIKARRSRVQHDASHEVKRANRVKRMLSDSLASGLTNGIYKGVENNPYKNMKLSQMGRELLFQSGRHPEARNYTAAQVYDLVLGSRYERRAAGGAINVASDFADLLTNTMTKAVLASYESMRGVQTFDPFVTRKTVENFKDQDRVALGESGKLSKVPPGADAPLFVMSDSKESYKIETYSKIFQLTRQGFIDDDTGELQAVLTSGHAAADLESDLVYDELAAGKVGGSVWYSSARKNVTSGSSSALNHSSYTGIRGIYTGLAKQTGMDVDTPLNLTVGWLVVPVELHFYANQTKQVQYPATLSAPNPYADMYQIIAEPRLDSKSTAVYYGIAKEAGAFRPFIELGTLSTQPVMKYEETFTNDVLRWKLTHDVGAKMLDYRLAHRVAGA